MPTRFAFDGAGYYEMAKRVPSLKLYHFDEVPQVEVSVRPVTGSRMPRIKPWDAGPVM